MKAKVKAKVKGVHTQCRCQVSGVSVNGEGHVLSHFTVNTFRYAELVVLHSI